MRARLIELGQGFAADVLLAAAALQGGGRMSWKRRYDGQRFYDRVLAPFVARHGAANGPLEFSCLRAGSSARRGSRSTTRPLRRGWRPNAAPWWCHSLSRQSWRWRHERGGYETVGEGGTILQPLVWARKRWFYGRRCCYPHPGPAREGAPRGAVLQHRALASPRHRGGRELPPSRLRGASRMGRVMAPPRGKAQAHRRGVRGAPCAARRGNRCATGCLEHRGIAGRGVRSYLPQSRRATPEGGP
jgi:hypothetical protein